MAKMNIAITATVANFEKYADDLGYQATIVTGMDAEGLPVTAPNPQTKAEYLAEKVKGIVSVALAQPTINVIRETKQTEARTAEVDTRTAIESVMNITFS